MPGDVSRNVVVKVRGEVSGQSLADELAKTGKEARSAHESLGAYQKRLKEVGGNVQSVTGVVARLFTEMNKDSAQATKNATELGKAFRSLSIDAENLKRVWGELRKAGFSDQQIQSGAQAAGIKGFGAPGLGSTLLRGLGGIGAVVAGAAQMAGEGMSAYYGDLGVKSQREHPDWFTREEEIQATRQNYGNIGRWAGRVGGAAIGAVGGFFSGGIPTLGIGAIPAAIAGGTAGWHVGGSVGESLAGGAADKATFDQREWLRRREFERRTISPHLEAEAQAFALRQNPQRLDFEGGVARRSYAEAKRLEPGIRDELQKMLPSLQQIQRFAPGPADEGILAQQRQQAAEMARGQALRVGESQQDVARAQLAAKQADDTVKALKEALAKNLNTGAEIGARDRLVDAMRRQTEASQEVARADLRHGAVIRETLEQRRGFALQQEAQGRQLRVGAEQEKYDFTTRFGFMLPGQRESLRRAEEALSAAEKAAPGDPQRILNQQWRQILEGAHVSVIDQRLQKLGHSIGVENGAGRLPFMRDVDQRIEDFRGMETSGQKAAAAAQKAIEARAEQDADKVAAHVAQVLKPAVDQLVNQIMVQVDKKIQEVYARLRNGPDAGLK